LRWGRTFTEVARRREAPRETRPRVKPADARSWCDESDVAIVHVGRLPCLAPESERDVNGTEMGQRDEIRVTRGNKRPWMVDPTR
jgi:hypothetical protein